jgi:hypothetical protein
MGYMKYLIIISIIVFIWYSFKQSKKYDIDHFNIRHETIRSLNEKLKEFSHLNERIFKKYIKYLKLFLNTHDVSKLEKYNNKSIRFLNDLKMHMHNDLYQELKLKSIIHQLDVTMKHIIHQEHKNSNINYVPTTQDVLKGYNYYEHF